MDMETAKKLGCKKVGEVADLFGITPRTVLYYEEEGIIQPIRTPGGTRMYSAADIRRFGIAYRMASLGIPIKIVRDLARIRQEAETGDESGRALCQTLDALDASIRSQMSDLDKLAREIDHARLLLKQCWNCPNKPDRINCPGCPCETGKNDAEILWLTWDVDGEMSGPKLTDAKSPDSTPLSKPRDESQPEPKSARSNPLPLRRKRLKVPGQA